MLLWLLTWLVQVTLVLEAFTALAMFALEERFFGMSNLMLDKPALERKRLSTFLTTESTFLHVTVHVFVQGCLGFEVFSTHHACYNSMVIFMVFVKVFHSVA